MRSTSGNLVSVALVAAGVLGGCDAGKPPAAAEPTVTLASIWEQTGQLAEFGTAARRAVDLAVSEYEERRPPGSPAIRLISQDAESSVEGAVMAFSAAVAGRQRPIAILGPLSSAAAMAISPRAEEAGIVMISAGASVPQLTYAGPHTYRIYPSDAYEAAAMVQYLTNLPDAPRTLVSVYPRNDYGVGLDSVFTAEAAGSITVLRRLAYPPDQADFRGLALQVVSFRPDAVYMPGYPPSVGPLSRALRQAGFRGLFISSLGVADESLFNLGGQAVEGMVLTVAAVPDSTAVATAEFRRAYASRFGVPATFPALYAYDVAQLVLTAIGDGARTAEDLKRRFHAGFAHDGVTGRFYFDENGDVVRGYDIVVAKSQQRRFEQITTVEAVHR